VWNVRREAASEHAADALPFGLFVHHSGDSWVKNGWFHGQG